MTDTTRNAGMPLFSGQEGEEKPSMDSEMPSHTADGRISRNIHFYQVIGLLTPGIVAKWSHLSSFALGRIIAAAVYSVNSTALPASLLSSRTAQRRPGKEKTARAIQLEQISPDYEQDSTAGKSRFHDYLGSEWGVLFRLR
jgi:hypothetical protein